MANFQETLNLSKLQNIFFGFDNITYTKLESFIRARNNIASKIERNDIRLEVWLMEIAPSCVYTISVGLI